MKRILCSALAATVALAAQSVPARSTGPEALKAAITFNIIRYVEFPGAAPNEPINLCVARGAAGARELAALNGQRVGMRPIAFRAIDPGSAGGCEVIFLAQAADIGRARQRGAIVIGDGSGFVGAGGTIGLVRTGAQVRFEVNTRAARESGIAISSRLLRLASRIEQ